jgi:hypothetical protein
VTCGDPGNARLARVDPAVIEVDGPTKRDGPVVGRRRCRWPVACYRASAVVAGIWVTDRVDVG